MYVNFPSFHTETGKTGHFNQNLSLPLWRWTLETKGRPELLPLSYLEQCRVQRRYHKPPREKLPLKKGSKLACLFPDKHQQGTLRATILDLPASVAGRVIDSKGT